MVKTKKRAQKKKASRAKRPQVRKAARRPKMRPKVASRRASPKKQAVSRPKTAIQVRMPSTVSVRGPPNLLVTYDPNKAAAARQEIVTLLKETGQEPKIDDSGIAGLFKITVSNPKEAVRKLSESCKKDPNRFAHTYHWSPVDNWVSSDIKQMQDTIVKVAENIGNDERWKMDLAKRQYDMEYPALITKLTEKVSRPKVDLSNPEKIIKVDILGKQAAISLLSREEYLNVQKVRAGKQKELKGKIREVSIVQEQDDEGSKKGKEDFRQTCSELLKKMENTFLKMKEKNQHDEFLHMIQQQKMKELWDNGEDETWDNGR